ncbi:wall-associated receptor kinase 2-like [Papaver somniferum]|uniref:wall-associated receptor kinase 2-like n=2 Tax=Papaver somniferum TaxID=3469 RepID=UPI000E6FBAB4|nr:wall-associated receptor kinase 2-like [Papaver somniferum]XP_026442944.1 wall-associated receptor kinase 2-like [Papaver somniferum]XP_026442945.1 wall-associated receptor kinase 2-like [Papaver somniferum]
MITEIFIASDCPDRESPNLFSTAYLGKFTFSNTKNRFVGMGCNTWAYLKPDGNRSISAGCLSVCDKIEDSTDGSCNGVGCCQASVPAGLQNLNYSVGSMSNTVVIEWTVGFQTCNEAKRNSTFYACGPNTDCTVPAGDSTQGYRCNCKNGYRGNPYLNSSTAGGCQGIDECNELEVCKGDRGSCKNTEGSYNCSCNKGYSIDIRNNITDCFLESQSDLPESRSTQNNNNVNKIVVGACLSLFILLVSLVTGFWI